MVMEHNPTSADEPGDKEKRGATNQKPSIVPPYTFPQEPSANEEKWRTEQRGNWYRQLLPQWALVAVSLGGVVAAFSTLNILNETMEATKDQVVAARLAAEMAKKSVDVSISASQQDQRAWVGVKNIRMVRFELNQPIIIEITISNSGKTVAKEMSSVVHVVEARGKIDIDKVSAGLAVNRSDNLVLFPDTDLTRTRDSFAPNEEKFTRMRSGASQLYVFGDIRYVDIFGNPRLTEFCGVYNPTLTTFNLCDQHQSAT